MTTAPSASIGRAEVSVVCAAGLSKHYLRQRRDGGKTGDEHTVIGTGTRKVTRLPVSLARGQRSPY